MVAKLPGDGKGYFSPATARRRPWGAAGGGAGGTYLSAAGRGAGPVGGGIVPSGGSRPGAHRSPGLWLWCSGAAPAGEGGNGARLRRCGGGSLTWGGGHPLLGVPAATISQAGVQLRGGCCNPSPAPGVPPPPGGGGVFRLEGEEP